MSRLLSMTALVLVWFAPSVQVLAQAELFKVVPDQALGLVAITKLDDVDAKVQAFTAHIKVPAPSPLASAKAMLGLQEGIAGKSAAGVILMPGADADATPSAVLLVPVTDYKAFVTQLNADKTDGSLAKGQAGGQEIAVGKVGSFAVIGQAGDGGVERFLAAKAGNGTALAPLQAWSAKNDATVIVTSAGIKAILPKIVSGLAQAKAEIPADSEQAQAILPMFDTLEKMLDVAGKEFSHMAIGVRTDAAQNLHFSARAQFVPGGKLAGMAKELKPVSGSKLAGLPAGPYVIAGGGLMPAEYGAMLSNWSIDMMKLNPMLSKITDEEAKKLGDLMVKMTKGSRSMSLVMGTPKEGESLYSRMVAVSKVDDAKAYMKTYREGLVEVKKLLGDRNIPGISYESKDIKIGNLDVIELTADMSALGADQNLPPEVQQLYAKMFGEGGKLTAYVAAADATTVVIAYVNQDALKSLIDSLAANKGNGLAADAGIQETTALLPPSAQWVLHYSPQGTLEMVKWFMAALPNAPPVNFPDFPPTPPIGIAVELSAAALQADIAIPAKVSAAIVEYGMALRAAQ